MSDKIDPIEFGKRLRSARKMAGFSMGDLVQKAGGVVTRQAISKYEKGMMKPSSEVLIRLSLALDIKPEYFYRSSKLSLSGVEFRKQTKLSAKNIEAIKQRTIDFLERYLELENILGIQVTFQNPVKDSSVNNIDDVEDIAQKLRAEWRLGLSPVPNLLELLEENGIKICLIQNIPGFDGLSACVGDIHVMVINQDMPPDRIRFTAAHELAHILCNYPEITHQEKLCHSFAGAFLLPSSILRRELMKNREHLTLWELGEIKELYGISMQAIVRRANILGIVSDFYYRNFQIMLNQKQWKIKEPVSYRGKEEPIRFKQLLHYAVSEEIISLSRGAELANKSLSGFQDEVRAAV